MVICGGRNIVVDVLICNDSVRDCYLRQFSDKELLVSQLCISVIQLLSKCIALLGSINLDISIYNVICHLYTSDSRLWIYSGGICQ